MIINVIVIVNISSIVYSTVIIIVIIIAIVFIAQHQFTRFLGSGSGVPVPSVVPPRVRVVRKDAVEALESSGPLRVLVVALLV